jgi:hypothetical protein
MMDHYVSAPLGRADEIARNVNGKLVKKDLKPGLVKMWNAKNAKKVRSKL